MLVLKVILLIAAAVAHVAAMPQILSAFLAASGLSAPVGFISTAIPRFGQMITRANIVVFAVGIALAGNAVGFSIVKKVAEFLSGHALAATGLSAPVGAVRVAADTKAMKEGLDFAGNLTMFTTNLIANASDHASHVARVGLNSTTYLGSKALDGGVKVVKQGLGFAKTIGKHIPGYGTIINMGADVGTVGLNVANTIGQKGLSLAARGGDQALTVGNRVVKGGAETVNNVAQTGISLGKNVVNRVDRVKDTFTEALNRYSGGLLFRSEKKNNSTSRRTGSFFTAVSNY